MGTSGAASEIVSVRIKPPKALERLQSAAVTVGAALVVGVVAAVVAGIAAFVVAFVRGTDMPTLTYRSVDPNDPSSALGPWTLTNTGASGAGMGAAALLTLAVVGVLVWLATCRMGRGTPGDAVMGILARDTEGRLIGARRAMLRTGVPMLMLVGGTALGLTRMSLLLVVVLWLPALVRHDRRSVFDLVAGVVPQSTEPERTSTGWTDIPVRR